MNLEKKLVRLDYKRAHIICFESGTCACAPLLDPPLCRIHPAGTVDADSGVAPQPGHCYFPSV